MDSKSSRRRISVSFLLLEQVEWVVRWDKWPRKYGDCIFTKTAKTICSTHYCNCIFLLCMHVSDLKVGCVFHACVLRMWLGPGTEPALNKWSLPYIIKKQTQMTTKNLLRQPMFTLFYELYSLKYSIMWYQTVLKIKQNQNKSHTPKYLLCTRGSQAFFRHNTFLFKIKTSTGLKMEFSFGVLEREGAWEGACMQISGSRHYRN